MMFFYTSMVQAHDPIFSHGPHVLFKDGVELHLEQTQTGLDTATQSSRSVAAKYGLTGDWVAGVLLPYERLDNKQQNTTARGNLQLSSKYRFWRNDMRGAQESAAVLVMLDTDTASQALDNQSRNYLLGMAYGYESLHWYRWASSRYRISGENNQGIKPGDVLFVDLTLGYRFKVNGYKEADTVWMLELNSVFNAQSQLNTVNIANTGGDRVFITPGIMWTLRNVAVKSGIQIPLSQNVNGNQSVLDYKALIELEWHL